MDTLKIKEQMVHIRISRDLFDLFKDMADHNSISASTYIRLLMKRELVRRKYVTRYRADRL